MTENKQSISKPNFARETVDKFVLWSTTRILGLMLGATLTFQRKRMSHNNGIAAKGTVRIVDNPRFPRHEFFEPGKVFPVRIRHGQATYLDEAMAALRSMSIKFSNHHLDSPFDLIMNTGEYSLFWSAASFLKLASLRKEHWGVQYIEYYRKYPVGLKAAQIGLRRAPSSYVNLRFYTQTPFLFIGKDGIKRYAKYRVVPFFDEPESGIIENPCDFDTSNQRVLPTETKSKLYLSNEYRERIKNGKAKYYLQIQTREADEEQDNIILNSTILWDENIYPYHNLAVIEINEALSWVESLKTSFSLNHMPKTLGILPSKSLYDFNSLNYMRANVEIARKARFLSYKLYGYPPPVPDNDNRNVTEWGD